MPGKDASVELQYLGLQRAQLAAESSKTRAGQLWEPAVGWIGDDFQQLLNTPAPDGGSITSSALASSGPSSSIPMVWEPPGSGTVDDLPGLQWSRPAEALIAGERRCGNCREIGDFKTRIGRGTSW
jgi:hypothetical protein